jgi:pantetheine-phosphate adenylyltransferase
MKLMPAKKALYPGSFDPFTLGHLDVLARAVELFDCVEIAIASNSRKKSILDAKERESLVKTATADLPNVKVSIVEGLVIDYARANDYRLLLRGIRAANDFEQELEMSQINRSLSLKGYKDSIETVFLMTSPEYSFIRASRVWELLELGGDVSTLVPDCVSKYLEGRNIGYFQQTR